MLLPSIEPVAQEITPVSVSHRDPYLMRGSAAYPGAQALWLDTRRQLQQEDADVIVVDAASAPLQRRQVIWDRPGPTHSGRESNVARLETRIDIPSYRPRTPPKSTHPLNSNVHREVIDLTDSPYRGLQQHAGVQSHSLHANSPNYLSDQMVEYRQQSSLYRPYQHYENADSTRPLDRSQHYSTKYIENRDLGSHQGDISARPPQTGFITLRENGRPVGFEGHHSRPGRSSSVYPSLSHDTSRGPVSSQRVGMIGNNDGFSAASHSSLRSIPSSYEPAIFESNSYRQSLPLSSHVEDVGHTRPGVAHPSRYETGQEAREMRERTSRASVAPREFVWPPGFNRKEGVM
jgi:hypothetical protein